MNHTTAIPEHAAGVQPNDMAPVSEVQANNKTNVTGVQLNNMVPVSGEPVKEPEVVSPFAAASQLPPAPSMDPETDVQPPIQNDAGPVAQRVVQDDGAEILIIPDAFKPVPGAKLTEGLYVGKTLGAGMQGGVYELLDGQGKDTQTVLKIAHAVGIGSVLVDLEREWRVGLALHDLSHPELAIKGFMGVGYGIRNKAGRFRGVIFERLHGRNLDKVLEDITFHDIKYIRQMLFEVFSALNEAQRRYGFAHHDFRAANLMEHRPEPKGTSAARAELKRTKTGLDYNTEDEHLAKASMNLSKITFKIIDYGLANFDQLYAADVSFKDRNRASEINQDIPAPSKKAGWNPVESMYHCFWGQKGDVHHLLWSMIPYLDGRVWPIEDRREVLQLLNLVHHCTGLRLNAWFDDIRVHEKAAKPRHMCGIFETREGKLWIIRRARLRLLGLGVPVNPGLTAAEALTAPLFRVYMDKPAGPGNEVIDIAVARHPLADPAKAV